MSRVGWRAHYPGGITYDSANTRPTELPDGMLGAVEFLAPPYRKIIDGGDWYWHEDGRWHASDTVWDGWVEKPRPDAIRGKALPDDRWEKARQRMLNDREWPDGD